MNGSVTFSSSVPLDFAVGGNSSSKSTSESCAIVVKLVGTKVSKIAIYVVTKSPIYTAGNFGHGSDESGTDTKKIALITHLHVLFSTVLNDVKL